MYAPKGTHPKHTHTHTHTHMNTHAHTHTHTHMNTHTHTHYEVLWVYAPEKSLAACERASRPYAKAEKDLAWMRLYFEEVMVVVVVVVVVVVCC